MAGEVENECKKNMRGLSACSGVRPVSGGTHFGNTSSGKVSV